VNTLDVIDQFLNSDYAAGDAFACLAQAIQLGDPTLAAKAGMRCYDVSRRLEAKQRKDPAHKPAPETVVGPIVSTPDWLEKCAESLPGEEMEFYEVLGEPLVYWRICNEVAEYWLKSERIWKRGELVTAEDVRRIGKRMTEVPEFARSG
jgi:hypothetical protein